MGALVCVCAVCGILALGLWPFHIPRNQVTWVPNEDALRFGDHGTALSVGAIQLPAIQAMTLELWINPARVWQHGKVLSFYDATHNALFMVKQDYTDLLLQRGMPAPRNHGRPPQLKVDEVFRKKSIFLTVTADAQQTTIYINGQRADATGDLQIRPEDLSGRLILANSPLRDDSWSGQMRALAIYGYAFSTEQVAEHYKHWIDGATLASQSGDQGLLLYCFNDRQGRTIHDRGTLGRNSYIPKKFVVVDHRWFEPPWSEVYTYSHYANDALINVVGFVPLGFVLAGYLSLATSIKRPLLLAVLMGATVSFLIEILQVFIPTRFSGVTDLFTNTFGTAIGAIVYRIAASHDWLDLAKDDETSAG